MIDAIGIAAVSLLRRQAHVSPRNDFWEQVRAVAPEPVWQYFLEIDAECRAERPAWDPIGAFDADAWLKRHHPAFDDVLEGLARAVQKFGVHSGASQILTFTQGWMIQWASARLGWVFATERPGAGIVTSVRYDNEVQQRAAFDLLGWSAAESHQQWGDPCAFLERWRSNVYAGAKLSVDVLAKAGLFDAEVALLDAEEER